MKLVVADQLARDQPFEALEHRVDEPGGARGRTHTPKEIHDRLDLGPPQVAHGTIDTPNGVLFLRRGS